MLKNSPTLISRAFANKNKYLLKISSQPTHAFFSSIIIPYEYFLMPLSFISFAIYSKLLNIYACRVRLETKQDEREKKAKAISKNIQ